MPSTGRHRPVRPERAGLEPGHAAALPIARNLRATTRFRVGPVLDTRRYPRAIIASARGHVPGLQPRKRSVHAPGRARQVFPTGGRGRGRGSPPRAPLLSHSCPHPKARGRTTGPGKCPPNHRLGQSEATRQFPRKTRYGSLFLAQIAHLVRAPTDRAGGDLVGRWAP